MKKLKFIFIFIFVFAFVLFLVLYVSKSFNKNQSPYLLKGEYTNPDIIVDGISIVKEGDLYYLYKNNQKLYERGYNQIDSVDYKLIEKGLKIEKDKLLKKFIAYKVGVAYILDEENEKVVSDDVMGITGYTLDGFFIYTRYTNKHSYYDYDGNLIDENYSRFNIDKYNKNIKNNLPLVLIAGDYIKEDFYFGKIKVSDVTDYREFDNNGLYLLTIDGKIRVYTGDGQLLNDKKYDQIYYYNYNDKYYNFCYDKSKMTLTYFNDYCEEIEIPRIAYPNNIVIESITNDHVYYRNINNKILMFQSKVDRKVFEEEMTYTPFGQLLYTKYENRNEILDKNGNKIYMTTNEIELVNWVQVGDKYYHILYCEGDKKYIYVNDEITRIYDTSHLDGSVFKLFCFNERLIFQKGYIDDKGFKVYDKISIINPKSVTDLKNVQFYDEANINFSNISYNFFQQEEKIIQYNQDTNEYDITFNLDDNLKNYDLYDTIDITSNYNFGSNSSIRIFNLVFKELDDKYILFYDTKNNTHKYYKLDYQVDNLFMSYENINTDVYEINDKLEVIHKFKINGEIEDVFTYNNKYYYILKDNNKFGLVGKNGKIILEPIYDNLNYLGNGTLKCFNNDKNKSYIYLINSKKLKELSGMHIDSYDHYFYTVLENNEMYLYSGNLNKMFKNPVTTDTEAGLGQIIYYDELSKTYKITNVEKFKLENGNYLIAYRPIS